MTDLASDPLAWRAVKAPLLADLEIVADEVFRRLPRRFRELCADVVIQVDDFPSDEVLDHMGTKTEFDLLGLFQGIGLPFRSESAPVQMPNMIWLYRRPILDYWAEHDETLGTIVKHVLVHEIGHHFGFERLMEVSARELGRDPADLRRINFVQSFPHQTPVILTYDVGDYDASLKKAMEIANYKGFGKRKDLHRGLRHRP
jgi:predicted Zn-dependent protease with MMP-like domain